MSIKPKTSKAIDKAGERFINFLKYRAIGPHALSKAQLKDLIRAGWITDFSPTAAVSSAYALTHAKVADALAPKAQREGALEFLERMFSRYAEKAGSELKNDIASILDSNIMPFVDRREGEEIYGLLKDPKNWGKYLGNALHGRVDNWRHRWSTIVKTELARASNWGAVDAILHNNKDKDPKDILVFKAGPNDERTCKHCAKFWFKEDGRTPRLYRLSELMANGSNIGRKAKDWLATVDPTHPHCRHLTVHLRPGYGFDANGNLQYKSKDHNELDFQLKKK
jgi:hypothetical protein